MITPIRAVAIEAKAPEMGTKSEGELVPNLNAPWTIDGETAQFYGSHAPNEQARLGAQILAQYLKAKRVPKTPFIQSAVSVSGNDLTMKTPVMVGQTAVGLVDEILDALDMMKQKPITLDMALDFIEALNLDIRKPSIAAIESEWAKAEEYYDAIPADKTITTHVRDGAKAVVAPFPVPEERTKLQVIGTKMVDFFTAFIAIFLLCFFLDGMGVIDYTKEGFREIFMNDSSETSTPPKEVENPDKKVEIDPAEIIPDPSVVDKDEE